MIFTIEVCASYTIYSLLIDLPSYKVSAEIKEKLN